MYLKYRIKEIYRKIRDFLFPRQKWLTSKIPNSWADKDYLFELISSELLIHYVDSEKCFEVIEWESERKSEKMIKEIYDWYKIGQKELQLKIDNLTEELFGNCNSLVRLNEFFAKSNRKKMLELTKLEEKLYNINTKYMIWLVENRNILWT